MSAAPHEKRVQRKREAPLGAFSAGFPGRKKPTGASAGEVRGRDPAPDAEEEAAGEAAAGEDMADMAGRGGRADKAWAKGLAQTFLLSQGRRTCSLVPRFCRAKLRAADIAPAEKHAPTFR